MAGSANDKSTVLAKYIQNLLDGLKVTLGVDNVLYGEQKQIPSGKTVVVTCGTKVRTRRVVGRAASGEPGGGTANRMEIIITVYSNTVGDEATQRLAVDELAEDVEVELHKDTSMGGNCTHGFVETWAPGLDYKPDSMFRAVQMIFVGNSTSLLDPTSP